MKVDKECIEDMFAVENVLWRMSEQYAALRNDGVAHENICSFLLERIRQPDELQVIEIVP